MIEMTKILIEKLKKRNANSGIAKVLATRESLIELWDNKYDDQWNSC